MALLRVCATGSLPAGIRDGAIIALLRAGGLRQVEICRLDLSDYSPEADTLMVKGKRNEEREFSAFWFRLAFLIALIPGGVPGGTLYLLCWLIIPSE